MLDALVRGLVRMHIVKSNKKIFCIGFMSIKPVRQKSEKGKFELMNDNLRNVRENRQVNRWL